MMSDEALEQSMVAGDKLQVWIDEMIRYCTGVE